LAINCFNSDEASSPDDIQADQFLLFLCGSQAFVPELHSPDGAPTFPFTSMKTTEAELWQSHWAVSCTEIRESFVDLVVINFNDQIRSIKQCNEFYLDYQIGPSDVQVGVTHWRAQGPIPVAPEVEPNESK
ncbi:unnamed protein product, partial [Allacma fusca]